MFQMSKKGHHEIDCKEIYDYIGDSISDSDSDYMDYLSDSSDSSDDIFP